MECGNENADGSFAHWKNLLAESKEVISRDIIAFTRRRYKDYYTEEKLKPLVKIPSTIDEIFFNKKSSESVSELQPHPQPDEHVGTEDEEEYKDEEGPDDEKETIYDEK